MADDLDISTPAAPSAREGCCQPFQCVCPADEPCHYDALARNMPMPRPEVEPPARG